MVLACRLLCCCRASWGRLAALLVRIWLLRDDFWTQKGSQNGPKSGPKRVLKKGPEKGTQHTPNPKKPQPLSLKVFRGWGVPSVGSAGYTSTSLTNPLASTTYPLRSRPPAEGKAENEALEKAFATSFSRKSFCNEFLSWRSLGSLLAALLGLSWGLFSSCSLGGLL